MISEREAESMPYHAYKVEIWRRLASFWESFESRTDSEAEFRARRLGVCYRNLIDWFLRSGKVDREGMIYDEIASCSGCGGREFPKRSDCDSCIAVVDEEVHRMAMGITPAEWAIWVDGRIVEGDE